MTWKPQEAADTDWELDTLPVGLIDPASRYRRSAEPEREPEPPPDIELPPASSIIVGIDEYRAQVPTDIPWRCRPIAYSGGVTLIAGPPKAGKSTLAAQLQRCCETGDDFLGAWPVKLSPVLLVTEEGGVAVVYKTDGLHRLEVLDRRSAIMAGYSFTQVLDAIRVWAFTHPGGIVFIDTLAIWGEIENENDAGEAGKAVALVTALAQATDMAVILIHHARKSGGEHGEAIRGSGAILATVDIAVEHSRTELGTDDRWLDVQGRVILPDRFRLSFDRLTLAYNIENQVDSRLAEIEADLVNVPPDGPGLSRAELGELWGKQPRKRIELLLNVGRMRQSFVKLGRTSAYRYWSIPPAWTPPLETDND